MALPQTKVSSLWHTEDTRNPIVLPLYSMTEEDAASENLFWEVFGKVEQAKQEWEATMDALPQLVCLVNSGGQILRANRTLEDWQLGTVMAVKGSNLHRLLHPQCTERPCPLETFLRKALVSTQPDEIEFEDVCMKRYLQIKVQPVPDRRRLQAQTSAVIIHDITERKTAEEQIRQSNEAFKRAVQARQEMLQNVSHELRTPLALILGYTHLLRDQTLGPLNQDQQEALTILSQRGHALQGMIERLLLLQTIETTQIHPVPCDPVVIVKRSIEEWQERASESKITLHLEVYADEELTITADQVLLRQTLGNLIENAIKFSPAQTNVTVFIKSEHDNVIIAVADQGIGVPVAQHKQIFENFHQLDGSSTRTFGGMGIGLYLCQKIIHAHNGRLWVESDGPGQGSTFYISLAKAQ